MASVDDMAEAKRREDNSTSKSNAEAKSLEEQRDVPYGKWVEVSYSKSLKTIYQDYKDDKAVPFSYMKIGGSYNEYTDYGSLKMEDSDSFGVSSYFKCVLKDKWMVEMDVLTSNENYITQNLDSALIDRLDFDDSPDGFAWVEEIGFTMFEEGDYISIDIDNESSSVGQFSIVLGGVKYSIDSPDKMDDEAKVRVNKVWYYDANWGTVVYEGEDLTGDDEIDNDDLPEDDEDDNDNDDNDDDDDDDGIDLEPTSILLILGLVGAILVGAYFVLRGGE